MVFNQRIKEVQKLVFDGCTVIFDSIAKFLGYPDNPTIEDKLNYKILSYLFLYSTLF